MKTTPWDSLLRDATIKAIDGVSKKLTAAERDAESKVTRLLDHWNKMETAEKEHAVGIAIAAVTTVVTAVVALRRRSQSTVKKTAKKVKAKKR